MKEMIEIPGLEPTGKIVPIVLLMKCTHISKWSGQEDVELELVNAHKNAAIAQYIDNGSRLTLNITNKARYGRFNIDDIVEVTLR